MKPAYRIAISYALGVTAFFIITAASLYLWLDEYKPTTSYRIEQNIGYLAKQNKFDLQGARKVGYTDKEIAEHLSELNMSTVRRIRTQFLIGGGSLYIVSILLIFAITIYRTSAG